MGVERLGQRPAELAGIEGAEYEWYYLSEQGRAYGVAALALRGDSLELHLTLRRYGPRTREALGRDREWLLGRARELGARRIVGLRAAADGRPDPRLTRFAALFGFSRQYLIQAVVLELEGALQPDPAVLDGPDAKEGP